MTDHDKDKDMAIDARDMLEGIHQVIDGAQKDIDDKFKVEQKIQLKAVQRRSWFMTKNPFWDAWFQKLFAQLISVKLWFAAIFVYLLKVGLITNVHFVTVISIILAFKGAFSVADVWKRNGTDSIIDKV